MRLQIKMGTGTLGEAEVLWHYVNDCLEVLQIHWQKPLQNQGVKVRLVSSDKDATHFLDKQSDMHVQLNYAKVNLTSGFVFADLGDLTSIVQSGKDSVLRPEPSFVKEIDWSRR